MDEIRFTPEELDYLTEISQEFEDTFEFIQAVDEQHKEDLEIFRNVGIVGSFLTTVGVIECTSEQARVVGTPFLMVGGAAIIFAVGGSLYERYKYRKQTR